MKDPEQHDGQTTALPVNELTRRLLRRGSEPIGVIDVRRAVELHSRASLFLGPRLELVDTLKKRYGVGERRVAAALVAPLQRADDPFPLSPGSPSPWADKTGIADAAQGKAAPTPPQEYRVRRPNSHLVPALSRPLVSESLVPLSHAAHEIPTTSHAKAAADPAPMHIQRKAVEIVPLVSPANSSAMPLVVAAGSSHPEITPDEQHVVGEIDHPSTARDFRSPKSTQEDSPRNTVASSGSTAALPRISEPPLAGSPLLTHLQRMGDSSASAERVGTVSEPDDLRPESTRQDSSPGGASRSNRALTLLPRISEAPTQSTATEMHLQRAAFGPATDSTAAVGALTTVPESSPELPARAAVAPEIRVAPLPVFNSIVWRKTDTNGARHESGAQAPPAIATPTYANSYQVMRQSSSEPASTIATAPPETPTSSGGGVDITRIAEHVSRIIARQLTIERERRGRTK